MADPLSPHMREIRALPGLLRPIAEQAGVFSALLAAERLGGQRVYIGQAGGPLAALIGIDAAACIGACMVEGRRQVVVPTRRAAEDALRRGLVPVLLADGHSFADISRVINLSESYMRQAMALEEGLTQASHRRSSPAPSHPQLPLCFAVDEN